MARQQLPPQIKKMTITDRKTGKTVVRYRSRSTPESIYKRDVEAGAPAVRHREAGPRRLAEISQQVSTDAFVPRKAGDGGALRDWLTSLHNARPQRSMAMHTAWLRCANNTALWPRRNSHVRVWISCWWRCATAVPNGEGPHTPAWSARSVNKAVDAWRAARIRMPTP